MKKIKFTLSFIFAILFTLSSCNNEITENLKSETDVENISSVNPYDFIGELHNIAMDSIRKNNLLEEEVKDFTLDYVRKHFEEEPSTRSIENSDEAMENIIRTSLAYKYRTRNFISIEDSIISSAPKEIQGYIKIMYDILSEVHSDSISLNKEFNKLDLLIINDSSLSEEDRAAALSVSTIGKHSYLYNFKTIKTRGITSTSVAKADLSGAVSGIISWKCWGKAAATGLMFGPGGIVLTVAREAILGGVLGSGIHVATGGFL